jgi:hypothetical protein
MPASFHTSAFCANAPETLAMTDLSLTKGRGLSKALSMARYGAGRQAENFGAANSA